MARSRQSWTMMLILTTTLTSKLVWITPCNQKRTGSFDGNIPSMLASSALNGMLNGNTTLFGNHSTATNPLDSLSAETAHWRLLETTTARIEIAGKLHSLPRKVSPFSLQNDLQVKPQSSNARPNTKTICPASDYTFGGNGIKKWNKGRNDGNNGLMTATAMVGTNKLLWSRVRPQGSASVVGRVCDF